MSAGVFRQATPRRRLSDKHKEWLVDGSGILPEIVKARGYYTVEPANAQMLVNFKLFDTKKFMIADEWLGIPVYRPDGQHHCDVFRLFGADVQTKYLWPTGYRIAVDIHPIALDWLDDEEYELSTTEGIKKCDALLSAALKENIKIIPLGLMGMWGWRSQGKPGSSVCQDFLDVPMGKRVMHVISDSDYRFNDDVRKGWNDATRYFASKEPKKSEEFGAKTRLIVVPPNGTAKQGADDYLAAGHDLKDLLALDSSPAFLSEEYTGPQHQIPVVYRRGLNVIAGANDVIPYLMEPIMPEDSITLMAGDSGTYKTWGALSLMLDGAFGYEWTGHPAMKQPENQFTTLYVNKEMGGQMMSIRLRQLANCKDYANNPDFDEIINKHIVMVEDKELDLAKQVHRDRLEALISETKARLVILDSLSMCWTGDENSASEVAEFFMQMRGITERQKICWMPIHHLVKPQAKNRQIDKFTVRGSGQIVQQSDTVLLFSLFEVEEQLEEGTKLVAVRHAKTRTTVELPGWAVAFKINDGLFFSLEYAGLLTEIKAKEYMKSHDPQKLMAWMMQIMSTMTGLKSSTGSPGLRSGNLVSLIGSAWPTSLGKRPADSTLRRHITGLAERGYLTCVEESKNQGDLFVLTNEEILDSEKE